MLSLLGLISCGGTSSVGRPHLDASVVSDGAFVADLPVSEASNPLCALYPIDGGSSVPFEAVHAIFNESCISCHSSQDGGSDGGAELDLGPAAWANLVRQPAPASEACGGTLVVPGNPDSSYLYQKLTEDHPCSGERMPRGDVALPLPDCLIALVRAWIATGAVGPPPTP